MDWRVWEILPEKYPDLVDVPRIVAEAYYWPDFLKPSNLLAVVDRIVVIAIIAIGMTMVIVTAGIDLSVGSLIALSAVIGTLIMKQLGGLAKIEEHNRTKAKLVYDTIDANPDFFRAPVASSSRSLMNIVIRMPTEELEAQFVAGGLERRMLGLKGHRSVGGCRASIYNAMPLEGVEVLAEFMKEFAKNNG